MRDEGLLIPNNLKMLRKKSAQPLVSFPFGGTTPLRHASKKQLTSWQEKIMKQIDTSFPRKYYYDMTFTIQYKSTSRDNTTKTRT